MPFSITTKDGITINNIPDDIAPDAQVLRQRVADIRSQRDQQAPQAAAAQPGVIPGEDISGRAAIGRTARGQGLPEGGIGSAIIEPALTIASGAIAEPIAGLAGIAQAINPFAEPGAGARAVEATREALTLQPTTQAGRAGLEAVAGVIEPVAEALSSAEEFLGDATLEATGSPALAAAAATIPTALTEILGVATVKGGLSTTKRLKQARSDGFIDKQIADAAPSIDQLKDTSRQVYKEIDDLGVTLKPEVFESMTNTISKEVKKAGLDPDITPKASKALARLEERVGDAVTLTEVDTLRKVAQNAAKSIEPAESALGVRIIDTIDNTLDNLSPKAFLKADEAAADIGKRYKTARDLWGRARRSELLEEAFEKARNQASGFENGIRVQFRSILNNKKQRRLFNESELNAMRKTVEGTKKQNFFKKVGRLSFGEGSATNILGGSVGVAAGAAVGGPVGAVIVPLVGQVSRSLAQRLTRQSAEFADQVVRAGKDARRIVRVYERNTPPNQRSAAELSELLQRNDLDLTRIKSPLGKEAAKLASDKATAAGVIAPAGDQATIQQQAQQQQAPQQAL